MAGKMALAITCAALLASCGPNPDLTPCAGWEGARPQTEQEFALAASAEMRGRVCNEIKLDAAAKYYQWGA